MTQDPFSKNAADQFLTGSSTAAKWPEVGYVVEGTVTGWSMVQQRDYDENEALFWEGKSMVIESLATDKSRPVMQLLLNIDGKPTGETWKGLKNTRVALPDDDGRRTLYVKAALQRAFKQGLKDAGNAKLEEGAYVRVERIEDGQASSAKRQAPHQYKVTWTRAASNAEAASDFLDSADDDAPTGNPWA